MVKIKLSYMEIDKKKMFLAVSSPLTKNILDRIGFDILKEKLDIVILDLFDFFNPHKSINYLAFESKNVEILRPLDLDMLNHSINNYKPEFLLDCTGKNRNTLFIQELCKKNDIIYIFDSISQSPIKNDSNFCYGKILTFILNKYSIPFINKLFSKKIIAPDVILLGGDSNDYWSNLAKVKIFTAGHAFFKSKSILCDLIYDKYILFLDDCLSDSFDFKLGHKKVINNKREYLRNLNLFFNRIEKKFNMKVVIAAHPNGIEYDSYSNNFGNRKVFFNKSSELSANCYLAITHYSRSIEFPVLYKKPIIQLYINEFDNFKNIVDEMTKRSKILKIKTLNIQSNNLEFDLKSPNIKGYDFFIMKYISKIKVDIQNPYAPLINHIYKSQLHA